MEVDKQRAILGALIGGINFSPLRGTAIRINYRQAAVLLRMLLPAMPEINTNVPPL